MLGFLVTLVFLIIEIRIRGVKMLPHFAYRVESDLIRTFGLADSYYSLRDFYAIPADDVVLSYSYSKICFVLRAGLHSCVGHHLAGTRYPRYGSALLHYARDGSGFGIEFLRIALYLLNERKGLTCNSQLSLLFRMHEIEWAHRLAFDRFIMWLCRNNNRLTNKGLLYLAEHNSSRVMVGDAGSGMLDRLRAYGTVSDPLALEVESVSDSTMSAHLCEPVADFTFPLSHPFIRLSHWALYLPLRLSHSLLRTKVLGGDTSFHDELRFLKMVLPFSGLGDTFVRLAAFLYCECCHMTRLDQLRIFRALRSMIESRIAGDLYPIFNRYYAERRLLTPDPSV